jgi:hypothetical protein
MLLVVALVVVLSVTFYLRQDPARALNRLESANSTHSGPSEQSANAGPFISYMPIVFSNSQRLIHDMTTYMVGDRRLYEVWHSSNSQARHQSQGDTSRFYHTKGDEIRAEWEELWASDEFIYRGIDTSPGHDQYYIAFDTPGEEGAVWSPRYWSAGEMFERNTYVTFFRKSDCSQVVSGFQQSWLRFVAHYPSYTFGSGITLNNVIELAWLLSPTAQPTESYFYAQGYGLVGWASDDRGYSYVNWIHDPGQRPDNSREVIGCINQSMSELLIMPTPQMRPLPPGYRAK